MTPAPPPSAPGTLYVVATPIGNLRDITLRALDVLKAVALVAAEDTRRVAKLLNHYGIRTPTRSLHAHNERERIPGLLAALAEGRSVALATDAGTPLVSDPGVLLVRRALEQGFTVEPVPGPSAVLAAVAMSGLVVQEFTFLGFPPSRSNHRKKWLLGLTGETRPLIMFEAPHRMARTLADIAETLGDVEVALCREITKAHEELVIGPIKDVLARLPVEKGEFTVVISAPSAAREQPRRPPDPLEVRATFGLMTEQCETRREAIRMTADKYGVRPKEIYAMLEDAKTP